MHHSGVTMSTEKDDTKKRKRKKKNGGGQQRLDAICLLPSAVADGDGKRALCSALEDETLAERLMLVFL